MTNEELTDNLRDLEDSLSVYWNKLHSLGDHELVSKEEELWAEISRLAQLGAAAINNVDHTSLLPSWRLVPVNEEEAKTLAKLSKEMELSEEQVFIQALRCYQFCKERMYIKDIFRKKK